MARMPFVGAALWFWRGCGHPQVRPISANVTAMHEAYPGHVDLILFENYFHDRDAVERLHHIHFVPEGGAPPERGPWCQFPIEPVATVPVVMVPSDVTVVVGP